jgi:hypothetical protein
MVTLTKGRRALGQCLLALRFDNTPVTYKKERHTNAAVDQLTGGRCPGSTSRKR